MPPRKGAPGDGPSKRTEKWDYVETFNGDKPWTGWCACEPHWLLAHPSKKGSKPCLPWLTFDALPCQRCGPQNEPEMIAYLGIWREMDTAPKLVIVREGAAEFIEGHKFGTYVEVFRAREAGSLCIVRRMLKQVPFRSTHRLRQKEADIWPSLLQMWKLNELTEWFKCQEGDAPRGVVPMPMRQRLSVPPPTTDVERLALDANRTVNLGSATEFGKTLGRLGKEFEKRRKEAQQNGHHPPDE